MRFIFVLSFISALASWTSSAKADTATCAADDKICYLKNLCPQEDSRGFVTHPNKWIISVTSRDESNAVDFVNLLDTLFEFTPFYYTRGYIKDAEVPGITTRGVVVDFEAMYYRNSLGLLSPEQQAELSSKYSLEVFFSKLLATENVTVMCSRTPNFGGHTGSN